MARNIFLEKYAKRDDKGKLDPMEIWPTHFTKGKLREHVGEFTKDVETLVPRNENVDPKKFAETLSSLASRSAVVSLRYSL